MPAVRSRAAAAPAVFLTNTPPAAPEPSAQAFRPASVIACPKGSAAFSHALIHALEPALRDQRLRTTARRYGHTPDAAGGTRQQLAQTLEAQWRVQLGLRRGWFAHQKNDLDPKARQKALTLIAESEDGSDAHHNCAHHASLDASRAHKGGCAHSHHQAGERGLLMVDLDEAAHGVYASVKQTLPIFNGEGAGKIKQEFAEQTDLLNRDPLGWMAHEVPPAGVGDFSAAIGTAALVAPLAVIAVKAGVHETRDALRIRRELDARADNLHTRRDALARLLPATPEPAAAKTLVDLHHQASAQAAADTGFAARINRLRLGIGLTSAASGATIFVKTAIDVVLKSALVASAKKFNVAHFVAEHGAASAAATAAGVAGTLVLGPLAGIFASALGFFFARKSALRQRAFRQDRARVEGFLRTVTEHLQTTGGLDPSISTYRTFIEKKLPQRARFYRLFKRWNFAFLGGSSLYAASALTKAALGIAALAGAGALISNPVGWGILLGVGVVGAVVMGVASWQFLFGHPKNERYERYFRDDHPELDRPFLTTLDIAPPEDGGPRWPGVLLRAQLFEQLEQHADALDRLKNRIARGMGKKPAATRDDFLPNLQARLAALGAGAGALLRTGRLDEARTRAHQTWSNRARHLTESNIASWIGSRDAQTAWPRFSKRYLIAQRDYLQHKLSCRLSLLKRHAVLSQQVECADPETRTALAGLLSELDQAAERDQVALERLRLCLSIKESNTERADRLLLGILTGVQDSALDALDASAVRRELATTLMRDQPRRLRDLKGMLLETEMQAARLRAASTRNPPRSAG